MRRIMSDINGEDCPRIKDPVLALFQELAEVYQDYSIYRVIDETVDVAPVVITRWISQNIVPSGGIRMRVKIALEMIKKSPESYPHLVPKKVKEQAPKAQKFFARSIHPKFKRMQRTPSALATLKRRTRKPSVTGAKRKSLEQQNLERLIQELGLGG